MTRAKIFVDFWNFADGEAKFWLEPKVGWPESMA